MVVGRQADAIQRFISGYCPEIVNHIVFTIASQYANILKDFEEKCKKSVVDFLQSKTISIPNSVLTAIPKLKSVQIEFGIPGQVLQSMQYNIEFRHMSLQDAVDFAMFLTTMTYGRQRFVSGIPTVGGKVNVATITIKDGFKLLTPKEISVPTINI